MLKRLYIKKLISFDEVELELSDGLIVLSGSSGAGKSLLLQAILANFGFTNPEARVCEFEMRKPSNMDIQEFELDDIITVKSIRRERSRFYLNNQNISKKRLKELFSPYIHCLSVRDNGDFTSQRLLSIIDLSISLKNSSYKSLLVEYQNRFEIYRDKLSELEKIKKQQKRVIEMIEFTKFEIDRIESIEPKDGEYEKLLVIKQKLSKIDKVQEAVQRANYIFELESNINEVFNLLDKDGTYFNEAMNQLRIDFEEVESLTQELEHIDIEQLLERLEKLSNLINRYGSIKKALEYKDKKIAELQKYEGIRYSKKELEEFIEFEKDKLLLLAKDLSVTRKSGAENIKKELNSYLNSLKLPEAKFIFKEIDIFEMGVDEVDLELNSSTISTLSGGEFNRLKLALMTVEAKLFSDREGIIFLDEMDANVSGDESIAIANMVEELSKRFQLFAISHQPHLSAKANQHIFISKREGISKAEILNSKDRRVEEVVRMISGERADREALAFARKLFNREKETG